MCIFCWYILCDRNNNNNQSLATRDRCSFKRPRSIKIYPAGMFLRGKVLYVCPNCNNVNLQVAIDSSSSLFCFCAYFFFGGDFDVEQDYMFFNTQKFNQDISQWNVSAGTNFVRNCLYFYVPFLSTFRGSIYFSHNSE